MTERLEKAGFPVEGVVFEVSWPNGELSIQISRHGLRDGTTPAVNPPKKV